MNDPLDDLLTPRPLIPGEGRKHDVLDRTTHALRWRLRWRRLGGVGILVATYIAGLLSVAAVTSPEQEPIVPERIVENVTPVPVPPVALEWRALDQPDEAAVLYREAADRYLEVGDASNAMRCYGNAIGETRSLEVNTDDSWLLIAIKHARKKERTP